MRSHSTTLPAQASTTDFNAEQLLARARIRERGRRWILSGWLISMIGVIGYCRAMFAVGPQAEFAEMLQQAGLQGWASLALIAGGVALWVMGNMFYFKDIVDSHGTGAPKA